MTLITSSPVEAAEIIKSGGTVAFPTETVYGLGASVFDETAIEKVFSAKQRPADNPLIAHIGDISWVGSLAKAVPDPAVALIEHFFPGPLTVVLEKADRVPSVATAGLDTIGIRMPGHRVAREFLLACNVPVVAPSANISGRPSPTTWRAALEDLDGRIDCILQGDAAEIGLESTVVDGTADTPILLRQGAISLDDLRKIVPQTRESTAEDIERGRSPGLRHRHYSPRSRVVIVETGDEYEETAEAAYIGLQRPVGDFAKVRICSSVDEYAHDLFEFFRECDRAGIKTIYCERVPEGGIGGALMDRLRRAAQA